MLVSENLASQARHKTRGPPLTANRVLEGPAKSSKGNVRPPCYGWWLSTCTHSIVSNRLPAQGTKQAGHQQLHFWKLGWAKSHHNGAWLATHRTAHCEARPRGVAGISISGGLLLFPLVTRLTRLNTFHRQITWFRLGLAFLLKVWVFACGRGLGQVSDVSPMDGRTDGRMESHTYSPSRVIPFVVPVTKGANDGGA